MEYYNNAKICLLTSAKRLYLYTKVPVISMNDDIMNHSTEVQYRNMLHLTGAHARPYQSYINK